MKKYEIIKSQEQNNQNGRFIVIIIIIDRIESNTNCLICRKSVKRYVQYVIITTWAVQHT